MRFLLLVLLMSGSAFATPPFSFRSCNNAQNVVIAQQVHAPVHSQIVAPVVVNHAFQQPIALPVPVIYNYPIAQQGNTIYGYASPAAQQYRAPNTVDLALLYSQANRLAEQSQQLASQATTGFQELVRQEALLQNSPSGEITLRLKIDGNNVRVQEYNLMSPPQPLQQNGNPECPNNTCVQPQVMQPQVMQPQVAPLTLDSVVQNKCYNCHNAKNAKGGLSFDSPVSVDMQQSIIDRITTDDASILMPRLADGSAAPKLSQEELNVFYQSMGVRK